MGNKGDGVLAVLIAYMSSIFIQVSALMVIAIFIIGIDWAVGSIMAWKSEGYDEDKVIKGTKRFIMQLLLWAVAFTFQLLIYMYGQYIGFSGQVPFLVVLSIIYSIGLYSKSIADNYRKAGYSIKWLDKLAESLTKKGSDDI